MIEALEKLEQAMGGSASNLLAEVHSSYTMESERAAHNDAARQTGSLQPEPTVMEVEIF
ncbi:MAG: hypothetical protein WDO73_35720 [Ignavibacteriota bacterium]